jgi:hypothetical protein
VEFDVPVRHLPPCLLVAYDIHDLAIELVVPVRQRRRVDDDVAAALDPDCRAELGFEFCEDRLAAGELCVVQVVARGRRDARDEVRRGEVVGRCDC